MANYAIESSGRPVGWLHLAGPRDLRSEDERFYAPLSDLRAADTRVFLGIVQPVDGVDGLRRRHATASKYLGGFGVAMFLQVRAPHGRGRDADDAQAPARRAGAHSPHASQ